MITSKTQHWKKYQSITIKFKLTTGKKFAQLALGHIFQFCDTFKKKTKNIDCQINLETNDLQDIVQLTLPRATFINVSFDKLNYFIPHFSPNPDMQVFYNESKN